MMKRLLVALLFTVACYGNATLAFSEQSAVSSTPQTTVFSVSHPVTNGQHMIVFFTVQSGSAGVMSMADDHSDSYRTDIANNQVADNYASAVYQTIISGSGSITLTGTWTNGTAAIGWIVVLVYNGVPSGLMPIDAAQVQTGANTSPTITTTSANDLIVAFIVGTNGGPPPTADSGFTLEQVQAVIWFRGGAVEDSVSNSIGSFSPAFGSPAMVSNGHIGVIAYISSSSNGPLLNGTAYMNGKAILQ